MKPFDEEKAKAGHAIITRGGYPARLLAWDLDDPEYVLVVAVNCGPGQEYVRLYDKNGQCNSDPRYDLFMAPVKKWRWVIAVGWELDITCQHYASAEGIHECSGGSWRAVQPIDETMIEE